LADKGWTLEALEAHAKEQAIAGRDFSTLSKILKGERSMPSGFLDELPHGAVGLWHARRAEAHGWKAVEPEADFDEAIRHLVIGLVSLAMRGALPIKAGRMAKMGEQQTTTRKAAV
jgi:hypothetical protein